MRKDDSLQRLVSFLLLMSLQDYFEHRSQMLFVFWNLHTIINIYKKKIEKEINTSIFL